MGYLATSTGVSAGPLKADFNGDGFDDLAIGAPGENLKPGPGSLVFGDGAVSVIYGTARGLRAKGNQFWHRNRKRIKGPDTTGFGDALATGDFNGDGFGDMVVGVPFEDLPDGTGGVLRDAGTVNVLYGSGKGLRTKGNQFWHQDIPGVEDAASDPSFGDMPGEGFGSAFAVGDFDGNGFDDLAIGVPGDLFTAGAVNVLYGSRKGLRTKGNQFWHQDSPGVQEVADRGHLLIIFPPFSVPIEIFIVGDKFGSALAAGDFNGDGRDDLAIGVPLEDLPNGVGDTNEDAGAVNVLYGTSKGLRARGNQLWHQDSPGVRDFAEVSDHFGGALTAGDFNNDGRDDLAIGVRGEDLPDSTDGTLDNAGAVNLLYGSRQGLTARGNQFWHQDSPGVKDKAEGGASFFTGDFFGKELATGDFNGDGRDDLAIGTSTEDLPDGTGANIDNAGAVNVLYGTGKGLSAKSDQFWHQDSPGVKGTANTDDFFGGGLTVGDFDDDGRDDLAIGVPRENLSDGAGGTVPDAGAMNVLYGSGKGLRAKGDQVWHQNRRGMKDSAEEDDHFGRSLP